MLEELRSQALINLMLLRKLECYAHQVQAEHSHPPGGVALLEHNSCLELFTAVDHRDVVESQKAAFEDVVAFAVDFVHPPGKVDQQFVKALLQPIAIGVPAPDAIHVVDSPASPRVHRRI